jgi:uncharacterized protein
MEAAAALEVLKRRKKVADSRSLVHACKHGNVDLASLYLDAGVAADVPGPNGTYPLEAAVEASQESVVRLLLARGASVKIPLILFSAIYAAAFTGSTEIIELLAAAGASASDIEGTTGFNALQLAQDMQNADAVRILMRLYDEAE